MDSDQRQPAEARFVRPVDGFCQPLPQASLRRVAQEALMRVARLPCPSPSPLPSPSPSPPPSRYPRAEPPALAEIEALCATLATGDLLQSRQILDAHLAAGRDKTWIAEALLPEAARLMGRRWESDEVSFVQVGQAVGRLQRLLRLVRAEAGPRPVDPARRALFATPEAETHTFGVIVAADMFRDHGWEIELSLSEPQDRLISDLTQSRVRLLGLSAAGPRSALPLTRLVEAVKAALPEIRVLICGKILHNCPEIARQIPADGHADDLETALSLADRLVLEARP
ncbi:cobalamin B12-binding domain-containing protein [Rhodovulum visakhapatnamense]|uniref:Methanogenic corrinoid protein MtbC1 n=1 Tax=Rhodovulum visakhapatnamense TaxID=364297 RepID=A0A4R8FY19_9RHOB|nr:cobalamin B12-binding domain-containing protein [Rhodovulum visakhapatnamense]TDX30530.1 methanogenic corrinoid protein MtbC1 [Rhodovulum visakhapatnamense]